MTKKYNRSKKYKSLRDEKLQTRYGISEDDFTKLKLKQKDQCVICAKSDTELVVDHCHVKGNVRGLLCQRCNLGLGHFKDNITYLAKAIQYLNRKTDKRRKASKAASDSRKEEKTSK
jgi:hypothetical protein